ncbi:AAA family ATPase, partial [Planktothrix sp.]
MSSSTLILYFPKMRISKVIIRSFKRFNDLVIQNIPETAKLVVMTGTNGSGKSSVFDAFMTWHRNLLYPNQNYDKDYHNKTGLPEIRIQDSVRIDFYQPIPDEREKKQKIFNFRT